jgi:lysozyme family protein
MESNFPRALAAVLKSEGGNDDDPSDHGGRTSRGITQREYTAWRREQGAQNRDVWSASQDEIDAIYHDEYWLPVCPTLPVGLDYLYFDMAVNAGPQRATILLQRALGVNADGRIGPITREAIKSVIDTGNEIPFVHKFSDAKRQFYMSLHQPKFTRGWLNRADETESLAIKMITNGG